MGGRAGFFFGGRAGFVRLFFDLLRKSKKCTWLKAVDPAVIRRGGGAADDCCWPSLHILYERITISLALKVLKTRMRNVLKVQFLNC